MIPEVCCSLPGHGKLFSTAVSLLQVAGVGTNIEFLGRLASHETFVEGDVHTGFIEVSKYIVSVSVTSHVTVSQHPLRHVILQQILFTIHMTIETLVHWACELASFPGLHAQLLSLAV